MNDWDVVNKEIERSKIVRINWKKILGISLTQSILLLRKEGLSSNEIFHVLVNGTKITQYLEENKYLYDKALNNLYTSVHSRCAERSTEEKIFG